MIYLIVFLLWSFGSPPPSLILAFSETPFFKEHPQNTGGFPTWLASHSTHWNHVWAISSEERNTLKSRISSMHSPRHGGCGNVIPLPSLIWRADRPWEAALWSVCSQNTGIMFPSASVSITFILSFLQVSFWGRVTILSLLAPCSPSGPRQCWLELGLLPQSSVPRRFGILGNETDLPQIAVLKMRLVS